jgi:sigma-E factor negative regulatory protein RseA
MDKIETREMISALADGQLRGDAFARGVELATADATGREAWQTYHLIGDVLRSGACAQVTPSGDFIARLQERLRDEPRHASIPVESESLRVAPAGREAANERVFRWKMVAGVASIAAVAAVGWSVVAGNGTGNGNAPAAGQFAVTAPAGTVLAGTERGVMIRDPELDELLAAHRQLGGGSALQTPDGFLRNATFDAPCR